MAPVAVRTRPVWSVRGYVALTKPRIIELLLVTTVPPMLLAQRGLPSLLLMLTTLAGGTLTAASANTINCYIDRDIDAIMRRTKRRPLVTGAADVSPRRALVFGLVLGAAGTLVLGFAVNWLAAALAAAAVLFYVFVYTLGLKRRTSANIVIGGAAGCFPVLIGWAAVTGRVGPPALLFAAVVFFWTPPHFWALSLTRTEDYARARIPMLPVVAGATETRRQILLYSITLVPVGLAPWLFGYADAVYGITALVAGLFMVAFAWRVRNEREGARADRAAHHLFAFSILYLFVLFAVLLVEGGLGGFGG